MSHPGCADTPATAAAVRKLQQEKHTLCTGHLMALQTTFWMTEPIDQSNRKTPAEGSVSDWKQESIYAHSLDMHCLLNTEMLQVIPLLQIHREACADATFSRGFAYPVNHYAYILNCLAQLPGHPLHLLWLTQLCICSPLGLPTNKCLGIERRAWK